MKMLNKSVKKDGFSTIVLVAIILFCVFFGSYIYVHEVTHEIVYRSFGVRSHFGVNWYCVYTEPDLSDFSKLSENEKLMLTLSQSIVEAIGYHLSMVYMLLVVQFVFFIFGLYIFFEKI